MAIDKTKLTGVEKVYPLNVSPYEQYMGDFQNPSVVSKINTMIQSLHQIGRLTNETVSQWNSVMKWIVEGGMDEIAETITNEKVSVALDEVMRMLDVSLDNGLKELAENVTDKKIDELLENGQFESMVSESLVEINEVVEGKLEGFNQRLAEKIGGNRKASLSDIDQTFKEAITGGAVAVVGKGSTADINIQNQAVNEYHTEFLTVGKNLFDKERYEYGSIDSVGGLTPSTNYFRPTYYIGVDDVANLIASHETTYAWYDGSYNFVKRDLNVAAGVSVQRPVGARILMISFFSGIRSIYQLEKGTVRTSYSTFETRLKTLKINPSQLTVGKSLNQKQIEDNAITHAELNGVKTGKNLFNENDLLKGFLLNSGNGDLSPAPVYWTSKHFSPNEPNTVYNFNKSGRLQWYDENFNYLSTVDKLTTTIGNVTSPENSKYHRISTGVLANAQFEKGLVETPYEKYHETNMNLKLNTSNFKDGSIPVSALMGDVSFENAKTTRYPSPARVTPQIIKWGGTTLQPVDVGHDGTLYAVRWDSKIYKSTDGINWTLSFDPNPFFTETGETCSQYTVLCSDTGRLIICTNKGKVYVTDEGKTTMSLKITYDKGTSMMNFGYDKKQNVILLASYALIKSATNQGREVWASRDNGATFTRVFYKDASTILNQNEYHIHDVCYDQYADTLIVSIGDMENRQISYSHDWGVTWKNVFDESEWGRNKLAPLHPTSFLVFPSGIAMGSDELPEGIYWWERPKTIAQPDIKYADITYKVNFSKPSDTLIGTFAHKGATLSTDKGLYGIMPFRNHETVTDGHSRLYATGDGGESFHEIFKAESDSGEYKGFINCLLRKEVDGVYAYATYSQLNDQYIFKAKLPEFLTV